MALVREKIKKSLIIVYKTHIKQLLNYGAPAIIQSSNYNRKTLEKIQNKAFRKATRSKHNASIIALQVHTGIPPLKLQLLQSTLKYYIKANTYQLPTANQFNISWQNTYKKINKELISETIEDYKTKSLHITPQTLSPIPSWQLPIPMINIDLKDEVIKGNPRQNITLTKEMIHEYENFTEIYTDGSKIGEKVGFGIYAPSINIQKSVRIHNNTSIFTAEAIAITTAIQIIMELHVNKSLILSDSLSVIQSLNSTNNMYAKNIIQLLKTITDNKQTVVFAWIPSHCGTLGNEKADKLAKNSLNNTEIQEFPYDIQEHNINIQKYITEKWQTVWNNHHDTLYKNIQPIISHNCQIHSQNIYLEALYTSFILDNPPLKYYQSKINKDINQNCPTCNLSESSHHFFFECNKYTNKRQQLIKKLNQHKLTHDVINLLKHKDIIPTTIAYIKQTHRFTKNS